MTLESIKDQFADDMGYDNWQQMKYKVLKYDGLEQAEKIVDMVAKEYAKAKLEKAAGKIPDFLYKNSDGYLRSGVGGDEVIQDQWEAHKESITNINLD